MLIRIDPVATHAETRVQNTTMKDEKKGRVESSQPLCTCTKARPSVESQLVVRDTIERCTGCTALI